MNEAAAIEAEIRRLEQERDQALLHLGGLNGQLRVWRQFLATVRDGEAQAERRADGQE